MAKILRIYIGRKGERFMNQETRTVVLILLMWLAMLFYSFSYISVEPIISVIWLFNAFIVLLVQFYYVSITLWEWLHD